MTTFLDGQQNMEPQQKANYGIEINQFKTGSGFATGSEILLVVHDGKRTLHVGFYYCPESKRISGIIAHHEISLIHNPMTKTLAPYLFYNCTYRMTRLKSSDIDSSMTMGIGRYKTFEHHFGVGLKVNITKAIYFSGSLGYGVYFGSIKKPEKLPYTNEIVGTNGFSPIGKVGFGIFIR